MKGEGEVGRNGGEKMKGWGGSCRNPGPNVQLPTHWGARLTACVRTNTSGNSRPGLTEADPPENSAVKGNPKGGAGCSPGG